MLERNHSVWYNSYAAIRFLAVVGTGSGFDFDGEEPLPFIF